MEEQGKMDCANCEIAKSATMRIQKEKKSNEIKKISLVCAAVVLCFACVCGTILGIYTIKKQQETIIEQQYALNMQYASLMDYVSGAKITTTHEANADGDGSIAVAGSGNTTAGGDVVNGE